MNAAAPHQGPWRLAAGQFLITGAVCATCAVACLFVKTGPEPLHAPALVRSLASSPAVWANLLLLTAFSTLGAYGLLTFFQPRLDPTRAALVYLLEPVVAAAYAYAATGRGLTATGLAGAVLILAANGLVEVLMARRGRRRATSGEGA